jgi:hypothetical protein
MTLADAIGTPPAGNSIAGVIGTPSAGRTLADAIGTPPAGSSIAGILGAPAAGTTLADTGQDIKDAIGRPPAGKTIYELVDVHFATKADIRSLKHLIKRHWFAEQAIEYVSSGQVRGAYGLLSHRVHLSDQARRASMTVEELKREADSLGMQDFLPDDPEDVEELLRTLRAIIDHLPDQPQRTSGAGTRRR